jgi:hypothetical protein
MESVIAIEVQAIEAYSGLDLTKANTASVHVMCVRRKGECDSVN